MKKRKKKSVSPVIATVLLVSIVIVMGAVIFLWIKGFVKEEGVKFGKNIKLVCEDVKFRADYSQGTLTIVNYGDVVPIFRVKLKIYREGGYETKDITELASTWPEAGLNAGLIFSENIGSISGADKIILIPALIGTSGAGEKVFTCEDRYGYEIES